jgi:hypothetical protein
MLPPDDPLDILNQAFREAYAARREAVLGRMGPIIAQIEDRLILRRGKERREAPAYTRRFHELKAVSHIPLAVYVILADTRVALDDAAWKRLAVIRERIVAVAADLDRRGFTPEQLARQRRILDGTLAFLDSVTAAGQAAPSALAAFARAQTPDLLGNAEDAARDQIETMHAVVEAWKQEMTPDELERLRAVVAVSHMARPGNVAVQYFSLTLGETWKGRFDQEGKRVLASEVAFNEAAAFTLLGTHALDESAAGRFFGEETRLARDILADAAERILADMFHKAPAVPSSRRKPSG